MRVNQGRIKFFTPETDKDDIPKHDWDMEDLFRQALYNDIEFDPETGDAKKKNTSEAFIWNRIQTVFLKGNTNRMAASDFLDATGVDLNVFEDYESEMELRNKFFTPSNTSEKIWSSILASISLLPSDETSVKTKKCLLMQFGSNGSLVKMGETFRLLTLKNFTKEQKEGIPKDELKRISDLNEQLNEAIIRLQEETKEKTLDAWTVFLDDAQKLATKGYEEDLRVFLQEDIEELLYYQNTSNIKKKILGDGSQNGWLVDPEDKNSELLIDRNKIDEFCELFNDFRMQTRNLQNLNLTNCLDEAFDLPYHQYNRHLGKARMWIKDNYSLEGFNGQ